VYSLDFKLEFDPDAAPEYGFTQSGNYSRFSDNARRTAFHGIGAPGW
jgi:hypothetical protein